MISPPIHLRYVLAIALLALSLSGCKSKQDQAIDQAKQQAASSGQAQQVVSTDKSGNTVTTVVQPPVPGQTGQVMTTTVTPNVAATGTGGAAPANGLSASSAPAVGSASGPVSGPVPLPARSPSINVPAGTGLAIRIDQRISVKESRAGDKFTGEVVEPVMDAGNQVVIPKGSQVDGIVDASHRRGHFKGASTLELRLTSLTLNGTSYPLETRDIQRQKKGKGKRSFAMIGGGTGLGMLIGGVASGGTGVLIGGLAGAGAGTAAAGLTGNRDMVIPAESILRFKLADDLVIQP